LVFDEVLKGAAREKFQPPTINKISRKDLLISFSKSIRFISISDNNAVEFRVLCQTQRHQILEKCIGLGHGIPYDNNLKCCFYFLNRLGPDSFQRRIANSLRPRRRNYKWLQYIAFLARIAGSVWKDFCHHPHFKMCPGRCHRSYHPAWS